MENTTSGAICSSGAISIGSIDVSGNSVLHISGANGEYWRLDSEPYTITLYRKVMKD